MKILLSIIIFFCCVNKFYSQCSGGELLRNPSFETYTSCPVSTNFNTGSPNTPIPDLTEWVHGNGASPDYFACGGTSGSYGFPGHDAPLPFPNGSACLGVLNYNSSGVLVTEPFAQCLTIPLVSGQTYTFSFKLAGNVSCNQPPVQVGIWGVTNCASVNNTSYLCPTSAGYSLLGLATTISPNTTSWYSGTITFVAPSSIASVIIGFNCTYPAPNCSFINYYYFDDLSLKGGGTPPTASASSGGVVTCSSPNVTLSGCWRGASTF